MPTAYRYTGQRLDAATGLYFYNARYYDPGLARFTQPDTMVPTPGDPQSLNRYSYVGNNPLRYTDPSGHEGWPPGFPNPYEWFAGLFGVPSSSKFADKTGLEEYRSLSADIGKDLYAGAEAVGKLVPYLEGALDTLSMGGYNALTALVGENIAQEKLSSGERTSRAMSSVVGVVLGKVVEEGGGIVLRSLTRSNFRINLLRFTGKSLDEVIDCEAHHVLPQKFEPLFNELGIDNIHDPQFGSWVEKTSHRQWSRAYNNRWEEFLNTKPSIKQMLDFARQLGGEYGFDINFK